MEMEDEEVQSPRPKRLERYRDGQLAGKVRDVGTYLVWPIGSGRKGVNGQAKGSGGELGVGFPYIPTRATPHLEVLVPVHWLSQNGRSHH